MIERKAKNTFLIGYTVLMVIMIMMSSCGSTKCFDIGTGQELTKSRCSGRYLSK